ncbi:MAG TPA: MBL fold metallo-hydrolase [Oribacterium sp.]|jgi:glyoxylase-like metal-dependent hydrolase (beta-lactamase superfamily II)|nr:MBL fold metallo-hydrolase [Oribacterium sp.]
MLKVSKYTTGVIQTNVYFAYDSETREAVIVDPAANAPHIIKIAEEELHLKPQAIVLTHGHFDHMMAAKEVAEHFQIPVYANEGERDLLADGEKNLSQNFGVSVTLSGEDVTFFKAGEVLHFLNREWQTIETPGHTAGSVCYFIQDGMEFQPEGADAVKKYPVLFSGDTLFKESFGRTDFPTGSEKALFKSIAEKLLVLPEDTTVFPGHEGQTSIGNERRYNPAAFLGKLH